MSNAYAPPGDLPTDDVSITVHGTTLTGWEEVRITRRLEACPNDFEIGFTEDFPGQVNSFVVQAGDPCVVAIGGDTVITGYVDQFAREYDKGSHTLSIKGRGKCQDLVDCSAEWPGGQISGANALEIATKLSAPYGITVTCLGDAGPAIPQFNLTIGESAFDIIERICRFAGLLAYEGADGNLLLANTQDTMAASGFAEGENVQSAHVLSDMSTRFSEYKCFLMSMDVTADAGSGGNLIGEATDPGVPRHRPKYLIAEAGGGGQDVCIRRATWEAARNSGRGFVATVIVDAWRDSAGALWAPNTLAPVSLPGLHCEATWTLGEVVYRRGSDGTTCEVTQMAPDAYKPEPILLQPEFVDVPPGAAPAGST